jgi:hypothetical protein
MVVSLHIESFIEAAAVLTSDWHRFMSQNEPSTAQVIPYFLQDSILIHYHTFQQGQPSMLISCTALFYS